MQDLSLISVEHVPGKQVKVYNPTNYPIIGKGKQGAVIKLSDKHCVKIFAAKKHFQRERNAYMNIQDSSIIPKLYFIGPNYIVMEYVKGITLKEYLRSKRVMTKALARRILSMFKEMRRLNFTRMNVRLKHIIVTKKRKFKIIDHVNSFAIHEPRPILLFKELERLGLLKKFLKLTKQIDGEIYSEWKKIMKKYF